MTFRQLHEQGCFVMPNPWDAGTAIALAAMGFPALATTSAGFAFARGRPDSPAALGVDAVCRVAWGAFLSAARKIADAGRFDALAKAAHFDELNALFEPPQNR